MTKAVRLVAYEVTGGKVVITDILEFCLGKKNQYSVRRAKKDMARHFTNPDIIERINGNVAGGTVDFIPNGKRSYTYCTLDGKNFLRRARHIFWQQN